jgi:putative Flp pilus-assembly TadE/G-like protein
MTGPGKIRRLWRQDSASVAAVTAVFLTALLAFVALGVDLGLLYSARAELQNAADSAALAGAATLITWDENNNAIAQADTAIATAQQFALLNQAQGVNLDLLSEDVGVGLWDLEGGSFDSEHIGASSNPDELTGLQVIMRRDSLANGPVGTIFAGAFGFGEVALTTDAAGYLGYAGDVPAETVDIPIAIKDVALDGGDGPNCGESVEFHSEGNENSEWTTFFTAPANDPSIMDYVDGSLSIPALGVGDEINVTNGVLSNNVFNNLANRFESEGTDSNGDGSIDQWLVIVPVIAGGSGGANTANIAGFAHLVITQVRPAPYKDLVATLQCGMVIPASSTGGGDYGTRAATPKLVQ